MADLTPAETLRAAAKVLREKAEALRAEAKPPQQPLMWFDEELIIGTTLTGGDADPMDHKLTRAEAGWIALMSPAVAEPLAAWLDGVAKDIDGHDPDGGCECTESDSYHRAMDVAAAILGGQS